MRLLIALFCLSFLVRWYRLPEYLFFGYEQGRDALVIADLYTLKDFTLIGPKTDIDGIFHGPWYYYLMTVPYGLTGGNPLGASLTLVTLTSLVPLVMYLLIKEVLGSWKWTLVAALITVFSFEAITYSRWLHHYSFSLLLVPLFFYSVWRYHKTNKGLYFLSSAVFAAFASQFEIVLVFQFAFVYLLLLFRQLVALPSRKTLLASIGATLAIFSPLIIFNFRHQFITISAIIKFLVSPGQRSLSLWGRVQEYLDSLIVIVNRSLVDLPDPILALPFYLILIVGLYLYWKDKNGRVPIYFFLAWSLMTLPIVFFGVYLQQLYVGSGLGWIGLLGLSLYGLWQRAATRVLGLLILGIVFVSWTHNLSKIDANRGFYFVTIQDDLNLQDQQNLLRFVHQDSAGQPYKLIAFTIPYFHQEAWDYLADFYYPRDQHQNSRLVYLVIESQVAPYHQEQWINDLGQTFLLEERKFGKIRLQKRNLVQQSETTRI